MWPNPQETADLITFTKIILNGKLHFLCSDWRRGCNKGHFYILSKTYLIFYHFLEMQMMFFSWLFQFYTSTRNQRILPLFSYNLSRCNIEHRNVFKTYPNIYDGAFLLLYLAQFFTKSMHCNTFLLLMLTFYMNLTLLS